MMMVKARNGDADAEKVGRQRSVSGSSMEGKDGDSGAASLCAWFERWMSGTLKDADAIAFPLVWSSQGVDSDFEDSTFEMLTIGSDASLDMQLVRMLAAQRASSRFALTAIEPRNAKNMSDGISDYTEAACLLAEDCVSVGFALRSVKVTSCIEGPDARAASICDLISRAVAERQTYSLVLVAPRCFEQFEAPSLDSFVSDITSLLQPSGVALICATCPKGPLRSIRSMFPVTYFSFQATFEDVMASCKHDFIRRSASILEESVDVTEILNMSDAGQRELATRLGLRWEATPKAMRDEVIGTSVQILEQSSISARKRRRMLPMEHSVCAFAVSASISAGQSSSAMRQAVEHVADQPSAAVWWPHGKGKNKQFVNHGLENWLETRKEWTTPLHDRPPEPPVVEYGAVIDGLANLRRTFELPGRMRLNDLIELYIDIWEAGD